MGVSTDSGVNQAASRTALPCTRSRAARCPHQRAFFAPRRMQALLLQSDKDGASVHSHLTELIQELLRSRKEDALTELENISLKIKARRYAEAARTTQVSGLGVCSPPPSGTVLSLSNRFPSRARASRTRSG